MTADAMTPGADDSAAAEVLRRARREADRYGDDPWVFLRELVQNARDAGATRIALWTQRDALIERVICDDDGCGMSAALVETGLLRLFSSQKQLAGAAGQFGVGFWSTLRFDPITVRVDTHDGRSALSIVVDVATGKVSEVAPQRRAPGTTVTLERRPRDAKLAEHVRASTTLRCGAITGLPGRAAPLLTVDGKDARRRFDDAFEDGDPSAPIAGDGFKGVVGFGRRPRVEVYVHGLLVKEALSLDELMPSRGRRARFAAGLSPVVVVEAPGLTLLLDRQEVVEDDLVRRIVEKCEAVLAELLEKLLDQLVPLPWWRRLLQRAGRRSRPLIFVGVLAPAALFSGWLTAQLVSPPPTAAPIVLSAGEQSRFIEDIRASSSPRVDDLPLDAPGWAVRVTTQEQLLLLRLEVLDRLDVQRGIIASPQTDLRPIPDGRGRIIAEVALDARGARVPLPHAPGTRVASASSGALLVDNHGLFTLERAPGAAEVRYLLAEGDLAPPPPLATIALPDELTAAARGLRTLSPALRVTAAKEWVQRRLRYGADPATRDAVARAGGDFFARVLAAGAGDCDVVNAVLAALLVESGVPARVGVGLVVQDSAVSPMLHAWTEAFVDGQVVVVDASPPIAMHAHRSPALASGAPAAGAPLERPRTMPAAAIPTPSIPTPSIPTPSIPTPSTPTPSTPTPSTPTATTTTWPLLLGALGVAALALAVLLFLVWRNRLRAAVPPGVDLTSIFAQALRRGDRHDPLGLWHRKLLPCHGGVALSLRQAEKLAARGMLATSRDPVQVRSGARVLIATDARVRDIQPLLFGVVDLDRARDVLESAPDARTRAVAALASSAAPGVEVRMMPGYGYREDPLPFTHPALLILLGERDATDVDSAVALYRRMSSLARRRR